MIVEAGPEPIKRSFYTHPDDLTRMHVTNGNASFDRKRYDEAISHFTRAAGTGTKFAIVHYNLGCAYLASESPWYASMSFDKAVNRKPNFKESYYNGAIACARLGYFESSKLRLLKAVNIDANYRKARNRLNDLKEKHP